MSKECRYITKSEISDYKKVMNDILPKVRKDFKNEFGFSYNFMMVGSSKRRLVVVLGDSHWDIDYQIVFNSKKINDINPHEIKFFLIERFKHHLNQNDYSVNNSNSVITIILKDKQFGNAKKSFDIAIIKNIQGLEEREILKNKSNNPNDNNDIKWQKLRHGSSILKRKKEIVGSAMWKKLREIYKNKKCQQILLNDPSQKKDSESLLAESIKETLDKFN